MRIGMLWYDNSKEPLQKKVEQAVLYYVNKYGKPVRTVYVNPKNVAEVDVAGVSIVESAQVQNNHLWVCESDAK